MAAIPNSGTKPNAIDSVRSKPGAFPFPKEINNIELNDMQYQRWAYLNRKMKQQALSRTIRRGRQ